jgi:peptidoglycan/LPS O-acetylase OafA/YrhL
MEPASVRAVESDATTPPRRRFYQPELDCLRFFAFFAVFIFHTLPHETDYYSTRHIPFAALIASVSRAGSFGVDLFFLLSAYLISQLLLGEKETFGHVSLKAFYLRRILRIWPLYFLAIFIGVLLTLVDPTSALSSEVCNRLPAALRKLAAIVNRSAGISYESTLEREL